jgi:primosomal protein N' (replication factor Y)
VNKKRFSPFFCAQVAVEKVKYAFDSFYIYTVPESICDFVKVGSRVYVPFGRNNKSRVGLIISFTEIPDAFGYKKILALVDSEPVLPPNLVKLAVWVASRCFCTVYEVASVMIPSKIRKIPNTKKKEISTLNFQKENNETIHQNPSLDTVSNIFKNSEFELNQNITNVQHKLCSDLDCCFTDENFEFEAIRIINKRISLTQHQQESYSKLKSWFLGYSLKPALLHGITGSGKTLVYLKLIELALVLKKNVLLMVPEISLISQAVDTFTEYFSLDFSIFHSGLTAYERCEAWEKVKTGEISVVIGTRSAVFAPFEQIGIVIIDEEQEPTYKSESSPRFHARDVARFRALSENGKLLLISATPSVETYYKAQKGIYELSVLNKRFGDAVLPKPMIIDMNLENKIDSERQISKTLIELINKKLARNEQIILLLDRRGFHTLIHCATCGSVISCKNCNVSLNYHLDTNKLTCHYCGCCTDNVFSCPLCGSDRLCFTGLGTQKLEDELKKIIPESKLLRIDADSVSSKKNYKNFFNKFKEEKYSIMLGTRMVAKGLNFENVTLVGVICADQSLFYQDFKSYERVFSLISQVAGRSGRGLKHGDAAIQTYYPDHPIINLASLQNYEDFFKNEIIIRKSMLYPPFSDICTVGFVGLDEEKTFKCCKKFCENLKKVAQDSFKEIPLRILNPTSAIVKKAFGKFRYKIMIKCKNNKEFRFFLRCVLTDFEKIRKINKVFVFVDMNSESVF